MSTVFQIRDGNGTVIAETGSDGEFQPGVVLEPGVYYAVMEERDVFGVDSPMCVTSMGTNPRPRIRVGVAYEPLNRSSSGE